MWAKETNSNWFSQESCLPRHGPETSATVTGHTHKHTYTHLHPDKLHENGTHKLKTLEMWSELDPNTTDLLFHNHLFSLSPTLVFIPLVSFSQRPCSISLSSLMISPHILSANPHDALLPALCYSFCSNVCSHPLTVSVPDLLLCSSQCFSSQSYHLDMSSLRTFYFLTIILSCQRKTSYFGAVQWIWDARIEIFSTHGDNKNKVYRGQDAACFLYL